METHELYHELYSEEIGKTARTRLLAWRIVLGVLAAGLVLGMVLFCVNADPIEPGTQQLKATVFLVLGGWLGLFLLFHGLSPASRENKHVLRIRQEEGMTETYEGRIRCGEKPEYIPGSVPVLRVRLEDDPHDGKALLRKSAAKDFPREGRLRLQIKNGFITAWQEAKQ
ncbi:MAG: hypothetical protein J5493_07440 [Lachnospiraceae bacterium]|nr:hypothetical protein [Lachnospiraceae bacterium]